jgi:hypothetical protein
VISFAIFFDLLVQATFHLSDYWVSQIPQFPLGGISKELIGVAKIGVDLKFLSADWILFVKPMLRFLLSSSRIWP